MKRLAPLRAASSVRKTYASAARVSRPGHGRVHAANGLARRAVSRGGNRKAIRDIRCARFASACGSFKVHIAVECTRSGNGRHGFASGQWDGTPQFKLRMTFLAGPGLLNQYQLGF